MAKIYVVDNGGQWTHREWRVLKYLGATTKIVQNDLGDIEASEELDGIVLSGGVETAVDEASLPAIDKLLDNPPYPILGICFGFQYMAKHFGGNVNQSSGSEYGKTTLVVDKAVSLLEGLPDKFQIWMSHNDEVSGLPDDFEILAHSEKCPVQAVRHMKLPLFGLQFHPEVEHTEHGYDIFKNFIAICEQHTKSKAK